MVERSIKLRENLATFRMERAALAARIEEHNRTLVRYGGDVNAYDTDLAAYKTSLADYAGRKADYESQTKTHNAEVADHNGQCTGAPLILTHAELNRFKADNFGPISANDGTLRFKDGFFEERNPARRENLVAFAAGKVFWNRMKSQRLADGQTLEAWFIAFSAANGSVIADMRLAKHNGDDLSAYGDLIDGPSQFGQVFRLNALQLAQPEGRGSRRTGSGSAANSAPGSLRSCAWTSDGRQSHVQDRCTSALLDRRRGIGIGAGLHG